MSCTSKIRATVFFVVMLCITHAGGVFAQTTFERELQKHTDSLLAPVKVAGDELLPNPVLQNLIAPSGWGGYGTYIFGGVGGDYAQPYRSTADLISFAGFCVGNPEKFVNIALSVNATDVSSTNNFSGNFTISRRIFTGSSISAGALQLFAKERESDAALSTFYFAFSHAVQGLPSATDGSSKLTYTIGIGSGRFYRKSPRDIQAGRGAHGTAVFASLSYELIKWLNVNAEWSGVNLGCSLGIKPFNKPLAIGIGITNLTRYSSDKPNASFVICYPLSLKR